MKATECVLLEASIYFHVLGWLICKKPATFGVCELPPASSVRHVCHRLISFSLLTPCCTCTSQAPLFLSLGGSFFQLDSELYLVFLSALVPILFLSLSFTQLIRALLPRVKHHNVRRFLKLTWLCPLFLLYPLVLSAQHACHFTSPLFYTFDYNPRQGKILSFLFPYTVTEQQCSLKSCFIPGNGRLFQISPVKTIGCAYVSTEGTLKQFLLLILEKLTF